MKAFTFGSWLVHVALVALCLSQQAAAANQPTTKVQLGRGELQVKLLNGGSLALSDVNFASGTVGHLKAEIQQVAGVPPHAQRLIYNETDLEGESRFLHEFGLGNSPGVIPSIQMLLHIYRVQSPADVALLEEPEGGSLHAISDSHKKPVLHEAPTTSTANESAPTSAGLPLFRDIRNWVFKWDFAEKAAAMFDPVAYLQKSTSKPLWLDMSSQDLFEYEINNEDRPSSYLEARARMASIVETAGRDRAGIDVGSSRSQQGSQQEPVDSDINNFAPDAFEDAEVVALFALHEQVRELLRANDHKRGWGALGLVDQRLINTRVLNSYTEAVAGFPANEITSGERSHSNDDCGICHDELESEPAIKLPCGHSYHKDCFEQWCPYLSAQHMYTGCPYCRQLFRPRLASALAGLLPMPSA